MKSLALIVGVVATSALLAFSSTSASACGGHKYRGYNSCCYTTSCYSCCCCTNYCYPYGYTFGGCGPHDWRYYY